MTRHIWSGFYKKTLEERQDQLRILFPEHDAGVLHGGGLTGDLADLMVENCIGTLGLPLGLAPGVVVNGKTYVVPLAVEEPSIIAAISATAKLAALSGGASATSTGNVMISQVQLLELEDPEAAVARLHAAQVQLVAVANGFCQSMVRRGGGVRSIHARLLPSRRHPERKSVVVHLHIDVCEAMGANVVNTVAEGVAPTLAAIARGRAGLKILSNLCTERMARAEVKLPVAALAMEGMSGLDVAKRIIEAQRFAEDDPHRAATHNKGVMNGIDAVAIATGQDWRAIESAAHAFAVRDGSYGPLTQYDLDADGGTLIGSIELPLSVGTRGGALRSHPTYRFTHALLGNPDARSLAHLIATVGLLQNFAALRALSTVGIQKGHMGLHARNLAISAGAPSALVPEVVAYMRSRGQVDVATASAYLQAHQIFQTRPAAAATPAVQPSTLFVELLLPQQPEPLRLDVVMETLGSEPVHFEVSHKGPQTALYRELFGAKGIGWLAATFETLERIKLASRAPQRSNHELQAKLKLASILLNLVTHRLMQSDPEVVTPFVHALIANADRNALMAQVDRTVPRLRVGLPLIQSLLNTFDHQVTRWVDHPEHAAGLHGEQRQILRSLVAPVVDGDFDGEVRVHAKRWQATLFLLCDALAVSPTLLTGERLDFLFQLGRYCERLGSFVHDVARFDRDALLAHEWNAYGQWLKRTAGTDGDEARATFLKMAEEGPADCLQRVLRGFPPADFFDPEVFEKLPSVLRAHYGV